MFRNKSNFKVHERKHTGEKPFKCKFCDKSFSSSGNRKEHHRRHTENKVYKCQQPNCSAAFHRHQQLIKHCLLEHNVEVEPRGLGCGGLQKYVDEALSDNEQVFVPVERNQLEAKPIFQVVKMRKRDQKTGKMEALEEPIYLEAQAIKFEAPRT